MNEKEMLEDFKNYGPLICNEQKSKIVPFQPEETYKLIDKEPCSPENHGTKQCQMQLDSKEIKNKKINIYNLK